MRSGRMGASGASSDAGAAADSDAGSVQEPGTGGAGVSGGSPAAGGSLASGGSPDGSGGSVETDGGFSDSPSACLAEPDVDRGLFVSLAGQDSNVCGTRGDPCRTIRGGLARAGERSLSTLYVGPGEFDAGFAVTSNLVLSGGWDAAWERNCTQPSETILKGIHEPDAPERPALAIRDTGGPVRLEYLTIQGKEPADVGGSHSVYGVWVSGASTEVALVQVRVRIPGGGDGADGRPGATALPATGTCGAGTGAAGVAGTDGASRAGAFSDTGYLPGHGGDGIDGESGATGERELAEPRFAESFACQSPCGSGVATELPRGEDGIGGCGGGGGEGAQGGRGGGASVALFVWDAQVTVEGGLYQAGRGGDGGDGFEGGEGGAGASGQDGAPGEFRTIEPSCCGTPTNVQAPGGRGFAGGTGGNGGAAAGGSGGAAYAVYAGGDAAVTLDSDVVLQTGDAGAAGGGPIPGFAGVAAQRYP